MARTKGVPTPRGNALNSKMERSPSATSVTTLSRSSDSKDQPVNDSPTGTPQPQAVKNAKSTTAIRVTDMKRTTSASSSQKRKSPPEDDTSTLSNKTLRPKLALRSSKAAAQSQNNVIHSSPQPQSRKPSNKRQKVSEPIRRSARFSRTTSEADVAVPDKVAVDKLEPKKSSKSTPRRSSARVGQRTSDSHAVIAENEVHQSNAQQPSPVSGAAGAAGGGSTVLEHQQNVAPSEPGFQTTPEIAARSDHSSVSGSLLPEEPEHQPSAHSDSTAHTSDSKVNDQLLVPTIENRTEASRTELQDDYLSDPSIPANLIYRLSREDAASIRPRDPFIDPAIQDTEMDTGFSNSHTDGTNISGNPNTNAPATSDQVYLPDIEQSELYMQDQAASGDVPTSTKGQKVKGRPASTKSKPIVNTYIDPAAVDAINDENNDDDKNSPVSASNTRSKNVANTYPRKQPFKAQVEYPGYPPNGSPIPNDYTLWDICQNMPNSLREETLLAFVQREWSANELCACLKDDVREILNARPGKDKTMVYQKRLERVKKDLIAKDEYQNLLAQQPPLREDGRPPWVKRGNVRRK